MMSAPGGPHGAQDRPRDEASGLDAKASGPREKPGAPHDEPRVVHVPELRRFEVFVGDTRAGLAAYRDEPGRRVFTHTEVDPAFEGRGLGGRLVAFALDATRAQGLSVAPLCPFVAAYIARHPEYGELVDPADKERSSRRPT
jgi:predicted GNAT family acetyltransferase